jgi:hypothetical protein
MEYGLQISDFRLQTRHPTHKNPENGWVSEEGASASEALIKPLSAHHFGHRLINIGASMNNISALRSTGSHVTTVLVLRPSQFHPISSSSLSD